MFIVMDYMPMSLFSFLNEAKALSLSEQDVKKVIYNLLCSLSFLHSAGIMHRDIKPANILIDGNLNVKLCDFGFSRPTLAKEVELEL